MKTLAASLIGLLVVGCAALQGGADAIQGTPSDPAAAGATGLNELLYVLAYAVTRDGLPWIVKKVSKKGPA